MAKLNFEDLNLSLLTTAPVMSTEGTLSLMHSIVDAVPESAPGYVEQAAERLDGVVKETDAALVARLGVEEGSGVAGLERSFDYFVDRVWGKIRDHTEELELYDHEGVELFDEEQKAEIDLEHNRELGKHAAHIAGRVFGASGTDFLRSNFPEQAVHMSKRLGYIEAQGLSEAFEEIVGSRLATLVSVSQERYEAMIKDRDSRMNADTADLGKLRTALLRAFTRYAAALVTALDELGEQVVIKALWPNLATRLRRTTRATGKSEDEVEEELAELEGALLGVNDEQEQGEGD